MRTCERCRLMQRGWTTPSVWCDYCRDEEAGFPAHTRARARHAAALAKREQEHRYSWRLRGHR